MEKSEENFLFFLFLKEDLISFLGCPQYDLCLEVQELY